jgi:hypothetical protein
MYRFTATGIAPDSVSFNARGEMFVHAPANLLRPETVEALFVLWRVTKQPRWRTYGWRIFEAFVRHCRNARGFAGLQNVEVKTPKQRSRQESFWTAETLKYLYLLFSDDATIPLDEFVFNTEAHPLPVFRSKTAT